MMILPAPMLLQHGRKTAPIAQEGWLYELKLDGYRLIAGVDNGKVVLNTRRGAEATKWFPEIVESLSKLGGGPHVMDGEVCVLDDIGRSDFSRLQDRARRRCWYEGCDAVVFCAFDMLALDGKSIIGARLEDRKAALKQLLSPAPASVMYVGHFDAKDSASLYTQAVALKLEGLVAKRLGSKYAPGVRSADWVKYKVPGAVPPERFAR